MENKSNYLLVGTTVLALLLAVVIFIVWMSRIGGTDKKEYDIFFKQAVSGLARGSGVAFSGVPVGEVKTISLMPDTPEFVRVRVAVNEDVPILQGTTASIESIGFTGVSQIALDGAIRGAPPIEEPGPEGKPVIPAKPGALGELLNNAPQLLERLTTLTERLTELLSDRNQASIAGILDNTNRISRELAARAPEISATLAEARVAVRQSGAAAEEIGKLAGTTNQLLTEDGRPLVQDLRRTIKQADKTLADIDATMKGAQPGIQAFSKQTLPQIGELVVELRDTSAALNAITNRVSRNPNSVLFGGPKLPDYEPRNDK
jgi:phospholipid/cholesterol/gamma-HCH transport system substrate-binding protein